MGSTPSSHVKLRSQAVKAIQKGEDNKLKELFQKEKKKRATLSLSNLQDADGTTLTTVATQFCRSASLKTILDFGANANIPDKHGKCPLHYALPNPDMVRLLVESGADINVRTPDGSTPLMLALKQTEDRFEATVELLIELGADVNICDKTKATPLHKAVALGNENIVRLIVEHGANLLLRDENGSTALLKAKVEGGVLIHKMLLRHFCRQYSTQPPSFTNDLSQTSKDDASTSTTSSSRNKNKDKDSETKKDDSKCCKVCWENSADAVLLWCGHVAVCLYCSEYLQLCPICCTQIEKAQKIFIT